MKGLYKRDFFLIHFENFSFVCIYASSCPSVLWRPLLWSVVPPNLCKLSGRKTYAAKVSGLMLWLPSEDQLYGNRIIIIIVDVTITLFPSLTFRLMSYLFDFNCVVIVFIVIVFDVRVNYV